MNLLERSIGRLDQASLPRLRHFLVAALSAIAIFVLQWFIMRQLPIRSDYLMLMLPLAFGVCYLVWMEERIWTISALLAHLIFMVALEKGVGVYEISFSAITHLGMAVWFAKEIVIRRERLVDSGFDLLLLSFVVISTITTFAANRIYGGDLMNYTREWFATYDLLLYFPLKKMLKGRRDVMILLAAFAIVGLVAGFDSVFTYRERLMQAVYEYQIEASRVFANETTAMAFLFMFATLFAYSRGIVGRILSFGGMGLGALFLGVSFARGAIVTGIAGMFVLSVILPFKRGRRVLVASGGAIIVLGGFLYLAFPNLVGTFAKSMEMRLGTVLKASKDDSFNARTIESRVILTKYVAENPLLGFGYGVLFKLTDPITGITAYSGYIHNGYVRPIYKFGIPLALLVYLMMVYPLIRLAVRHPDRVNDPFLWGITAGSSSYLIAIIALNYTTEVFSVFWSVLNFTVVWALLDYVNRELKQRERFEIMAAEPLDGRSLVGLSPEAG